MLSDDEIEAITQEHVRKNYPADCEILRRERRLEPDGIYFVANVAKPACPLLRWVGRLLRSTSVWRNMGVRIWTDCPFGLLAEVVRGRLASRKVPHDCSKTEISSPIGPSTCGATSVVLHRHGKDAGHQRWHSTLFPTGLTLGSAAYSTSAGAVTMAAAIASL